MASSSGYPQLIVQILRRSLPALALSKPVCLEVLLCGGAEPARLMAQLRLLKPFRDIPQRQPERLRVLSQAFQAYVSLTMQNSFFLQLDHLLNAKSQPLKNSALRADRFASDFLSKFYQSSPSDLCTFIQSEYADASAKLLVWQSVEALESYYTAGRASARRSDFDIGWIRDWYTQVEKYSHSNLDEVFLPIAGASPQTVSADQLWEVMQRWDRGTRSDRNLLSSDKWPDAQYFPVLDSVMNADSPQNLLQRVTANHADAACESFAYHLISSLGRGELLHQSSSQNWQSIVGQPVPLTVRNEVVALVSVKKIALAENAFSLLLSLDLQNPYIKQFRHVETIEWANLKEATDNQGNAYAELVQLSQGRGLTEKHTYTFQSMWVPALSERASMLTISISNSSILLHTLPKTSKSETRLMNPSRVITDDIRITVPL